MSKYRDMYRIALHISRYLSYQMTAVSSQPTSHKVPHIEALTPENLLFNLHDSGTIRPQTL